MPKSIDKLRAEHQKPVARDEEYQKAINWCQTEKKGAKACVKHNTQWKKINVKALQRKISQKKKSKASENSSMTLTPMEEKELVTWINDCALSQAGKYREQIAEKVREILKMRHKMNKRGGRLNVPLSKPAARVVLGGVVTKDWFNHFFARNMDKIKWYVPQHIDTQRAASNTEEAVEAHFEGIYGLRQELIETGIMDPQTGVIADPRCVLNRDELPQFIDYGTNKGNAKRKVAGSSSGPAPVKPSSSNRTSNTIDMTIGLDGFQYGFHALIERATVTEDLCIDEFASFDNKICEQFGVSTHGLISTTEHGVQTGASLLAAYKMLDRELSMRGVPRPVCMLTDAHASRQDEEVLEFCREVRIREFAEPPATSQWAQALDQYNKMFHERYNKERHRYKQEQPGGSSS